jgi:hypothetical protein
MSSKSDRFVLNLVTNAAEALDRQNRFITVTTKRIGVAAEPIGRDLAGLTAGEYVLLTLADTGRGMNAARYRTFPRTLD